MEYITQVELASAVGVSKQYIGKLVKDGKFDGCYKKVGNSKKLIRDCAIQTYYANKQPSRQNQRDAVKLKKQVSLEKKDEAIKLTDDDIKDDSKVYTDDRVNELALLLADAISSGQKVQIAKDFWQSEINRLKALEIDGELVRKDDVQRGAFEAGRMVRDKLQGISMRLATILEGKSADEIRDILDGEIDIILEEMAR